MTPPRCLTPNCQRLARTKGCCQVHYNRLRRLVLAGLTTWAALEAAGHCLPPQSRAAAKERFFRVLKVWTRKGART